MANEDVSEKYNGEMHPHPRSAADSEDETRLTEGIRKRLPLEYEGDPSQTLSSANLYRYERRRVRYIPNCPGKIVLPIKHNVQMHQKRWLLMYWAKIQILSSEDL